MVLRLGNRSDYRRLVFAGFKVNVSAEFAGFGVAVHAHVDHGRAFANHVGGHKFGTADRHYENVGFRGHFCKVFCAAVGNGDGGIAVKKQL